MSKYFSVSQMEEITTYLKNKINSLQVIEVPPLKALNQCSLTDMVNIIDAYYNGFFSLSEIQEVWNVGDTISIPISGVSKLNDAAYSISSGNITAILADFCKDDLVTPINNHNKALVTFVYQPPGGNGRRIKNDDTTTGNVPSWKSDYSRDWCNSNFYNALDTSVKNNIKTVSKKSAYSNLNASLETEDLCWYISASEYIGNTTYKSLEGSVHYSYFNSSGSDPRIGRTFRNEGVVVFSYANENGGYAAWGENIGENWLTYIGFCL